MDPARIVVIGGDLPHGESVQDCLGADWDVSLVPATGDDVTGRARAAVVAHQPDLIILTVGLTVAASGADGVDPHTAAEVCLTLRRDNRVGSIPVLVLGLDGRSTASERDPAMTPGATLAATPGAWLERGASDVITSPFDSHLLRARVHTLVELRRLREEQAHAVGVERASGVMSRRVFESVLRRESGRLRRTDGHLGLLLVELDHFKAFRAHEGAEAAESCFQQVADAVAGRLRRPSDLVARFSVEHLACLMPDTDLRGARVVGESVRDAVEAMGLPHPASPVADHVTVSVGVASRRCSGPEVDSWLLSEAQDRLRRARRAGCNRVVSGDGSAPMPTFGAASTTLWTIPGRRPLREAGTG